MSGGIAAGITGTLLLFFGFSIKAFAQDAVLPVRLMFYNVENLFDTKDDPLVDDDEFLPGGVRRWNHSRYMKKINAISKTILAAGEWEPPAVVAFCEIENRHVLEDLIYATGLSRFSYKIIHQDSPDERGIDVCLIYREDVVKCIDYSYYNPFSRSDGFKSRDILHSVFMTGTDTLNLFVSHWPSRRGGVLAGEKERLLVAEYLRAGIDSIAFFHKEPAIIIMGDFNAAPDDPAVSVLTGHPGEGTAMINLSAELNNDRGTYRYRGIWEIIDQVLVSERLIKGSRNLVTAPEMLRIFAPGFLLVEDTTYPGTEPFSTYSGYKYRGGFSDHLPVILDLVLR